MRKTVSKITSLNIVRPKKAKKINLNTLIQSKKISKNEVFCNGVCKSKQCIEAQKMPLILVFATDLAGGKELIEKDVLFKLLEGLLAISVKVIVFDTERPSDLDKLENIHCLDNSHIIWFNPLVREGDNNRFNKELDRIFLAADMALLNGNRPELYNLLLSYGIVLIAPEQGDQLGNYSPNTERGNAFLFKKADTWSIFATIIRALENYKFPFDWQHIIKNGIKKA